MPHCGSYPNLLEIRNPPEQLWLLRLGHRPAPRPMEVCRASRAPHRVRQKDSRHALQQQCHSLPASLGPNVLLLGVELRRLVSSRASRTAVALSNPTGLSRRGFEVRSITRDRSRPSNCDEKSPTGSPMGSLAEIAVSSARHDFQNRANCRRICLLSRSSPGCT